MARIRLRFGLSAMPAPVSAPHAYGIAQTPPRRAIFRTAQSQGGRCLAKLPRASGGNNMRILIAGILGGIAMYIVLSVMHLSPLGQVGVHAMPNGDAVVAQISDAAGGKGGLYFAPDHMSAKP